MLIRFFKFTKHARYDRIDKKNVEKAQTKVNDMVEVVEQVENIEKQDNVEKNKEQFTILGYSIWKIFAYFIIYSVLGFIIETLFGAITKGVLESRKSFLYGPFCGIYGLGAVVMILFLQYFKKNNNTLFWGGFLVGSIIEYVISLIGELIFNVKWWDYSDIPLNIGGRVCVLFSLFWGFLAIYLMTYINPKIDKLIKYIKSKVKINKLKIITVVAIVFLFVDFFVISIALKMFFLRMVYQNEVDISDRQIIEQAYNKVYGNDKVSKIIHKYFGDRKMLRTFPNLKIKDNNGNIVFMHDLLPDIQPYYIKFHERKWL